MIADLLLIAFVVMLLLVVAILYNDAEHWKHLANERGETIDRLMEALARKEGVTLDLRKPDPTSAAQVIKGLMERKTPPPYFKSKPPEPIDHHQV